MHGHVLRDRSASDLRSACSALAGVLRAELGRGRGPPPLAAAAAAARRAGGSLAASGRAASCRSACAWPRHLFALVRVVRSRGAVMHVVARSRGHVAMWSRGHVVRVAHYSLSAW